MNSYRVVRIASCPVNMMMVDFPITDINVAYTVCEGYNKYFCHSNCGCQFRVEEDDGLWLSGDISGPYNPPTINIDPINTQPIWIVPNDYTWTIPATYNTIAGNWVNTNIASTIPINAATTNTTSATALPYIYTTKI